jgi:hypothetical protein
MRLGVNAAKLDLTQRRKCAKQIEALKGRQNENSRLTETVCDISEIDRDCDLVRPTCVQTPSAHSFFRIRPRATVKTTRETTALRTGHHANRFACSKCL